MARRCSYCWGTGHNRRTCTVLMEDKKTVLKAAKKRRKHMAAALQKVGFGPGALVSAPIRQWGTDGKRKTYVIKDINLDQMLRDADYNSYVVAVRDATKLNKATSLQLSLLPMIEEFDFIPRHTDSENRWNITGKMYVNPEQTYRILSPSNRPVEAKEDLGSRARDHIFINMNIIPGSYRPEDKRRKNLMMQEIINFINPKEQVKYN